MSEYHVILTSEVLSQKHKTMTLKVVLKSLKPVILLKYLFKIFIYSEVHKPTFQLLGTLPITLKNKKSTKAYIEHKSFPNAFLNNSIPRLI